MKYAVLLSKHARKAVERLPRSIRARIEDAFKRLQSDPHTPGHKQLHTQKGKYERIRVGEYRVIYEVTHEIRIIFIIRVGHRRNVYRGV